MTAMLGSPRSTRWRGGGVVVLAGLVGLAGSQSAIALALAAVVAWIGWRDVERFTIPDAANASLLALAMASRWAASDAYLRSAAVLSVTVDAALPGLCLWLFRAIYFRRNGADGIGFGDVKLGFAGGALVGCVGFASALFGASAAGLVFVHARAGVGRGLGRIDRIAFGAVLAPALGIVWASQQASSVPPFGWG